MRKTNLFSPIILLIIGLTLGGTIVFLFFRNSKNYHEEENVIVIQESVKRVFKIVAAEGYFSEILDYKQTQRYFGIIPSQKKAIVKVHGKALVGFDMAKAEIEFDEETKTVRIKKFPEPEILAVDAKVEYFDLVNGYFNKFSEKDLSGLHTRAIQKMRDAAKDSNLGKIAIEQMETLLPEMIESHHWKLERATPEIEIEINNRK